MGRRISDMSQHLPRLVDGVMLASRVATAAMLSRHPDQISRHNQPIACDLRTHLELYDVDAVERSLAKRRRRVA